LVGLARATPFMHDAKTLESDIDSLNAEEEEEEFDPSFNDPSDKHNYCTDELLAQDWVGYHNPPDECGCLCNAPECMECPEDHKPIVKENTVQCRKVTCPPSYNVEDEDGTPKCSQGGAASADVRYKKMCPPDYEYKSNRCTKTLKCCTDEQNLFGSRDFQGNCEVSIVPLDCAADAKKTEIVISSDHEHFKHIVHHLRGKEEDVEHKVPFNTISETKIDNPSYCIYKTDPITAEPEIDIQPATPKFNKVGCDEPTKADRSILEGLACGPLLDVNRRRYLRDVPVQQKASCPAKPGASPSSISHCKGCVPKCLSLIYRAEECHNFFKEAKGNNGVHTQHCFPTDSKGQSEKNDLYMKSPGTEGYLELASAHTFALKRVPSSVVQSQMGDWSTFVETTFSVNCRSIFDNVVKHADQFGTERLTLTACLKNCQKFHY